MIFSFSFMIPAQEMDRKISKNASEDYNYNDDSDIISDYWPSWYVQFSYSNMILNSRRFDIYPYVGSSFSFGKTFYIRPGANEKLRWGIDWSILDLEYTNYLIQHDYAEQIDQYQSVVRSEDINLKRYSAGMQLGPSLSYRPGKNFMLRAYCRFMPVYSIAVDADNTVYKNFHPCCTFGASVNYRFIGLGAEGVFGGTAKNSSDMAYTDVLIKGVRAVLVFRFGKK